MYSRDEAEQAELKARLGKGARFDANAAPAGDLLSARRGTAYFARKLNELGDTSLREPSAIPGWTKQHVICHVSYHARALSRTIAVARLGQPEPMCGSQEERLAEIELGSTLPARAVRHLFEHTVIHLNVEWRDLADADWERAGQDAEQRALPLRETPWRRAVCVWLGAVLLDQRPSFPDVPTKIRTHLDAAVETVPAQEKGPVLARLIGWPEAEKILRGFDFAAGSLRSMSNTGGLNEQDL